MSFVEIIYAGFPSPAADHIEKELDLNQLLKPHPSSTYFGRVSGNCMLEFHIPDKSIIVIDKSVKPYHNCFIVLVHEGELLLRRFGKKNNRVTLSAANTHEPVILSKEQPLEIWGTVTNVIINIKECTL